MRFTARWMPWVRRTVQVAFLVLFAVLLLGTRTRDPEQPGEAVQFFFDLDPLVLVGTWLSAHAIPTAAWLAVVTLAVTVLFGRYFCGWVCPLGTLNDVVSRIGRLFRRETPVPQTWSPWQRTKYYLLAALLVMAVFGVHWIGVFDPIAFLYRSTVAGVLPVTQYAVETSTTAIYHHTDTSAGGLHLTTVTEPVYEFLRDKVFVAPSQAFVGSVPILAVFVAVMLLNLYRRRFWCRYICPLGALLGLCGKRPLLKVRPGPEECTLCNRCAHNCQGGASPEIPNGWRSSECFMCWNCTSACNNQALVFQLETPWRKPKPVPVDLGKRATLAAGVAGVGGLLMFRATPQAQARTYNPKLIRPPGARAEDDFLERCLQCGLCMKVCPTNALHPTGLEAGIEGLWTPMLVPRIGYCEYNCNLCGQVCPTGAIEALPIEEKQQVKLGLATFDRSRCLPYAYNRECLVCEEHCPVPKKAIFFIEKEVKLRDGTTRVVKQPQVDPDLCIGCGNCESVCVFVDIPAVRVTSANETRHPDNQPILPSLGDSGGSDPYGGGSPY